MAEKKFAKTVAVDFDGVLHLYNSGWLGAEIIPDGPVPGAMRWLWQLIEYGFDVCISSTRCSTSDGRRAMREALTTWMQDEVSDIAAKDVNHRVWFAEKKPAAWVTIDDRVMCFRGEFPTTKEIDEFKPWNKK